MVGLHDPLPELGSWRVRVGWKIGWHVEIRGRQERVQSSARGPKRTASASVDHLDALFLP